LKHFVRKSSGFTLMELVITIVIIGILSAVVTMTVATAKAQHGVTTEADTFRRNLSHLQLLAISQSTRLQLHVAAGSYTVTSCSTVASGNCTGIVNDPATGSNFTVSLVDASFTNGTGDYWFDSLGRPVTDASAAGLRTTITPPFKLSDSGNKRCVTVTIRPVTGFATTDYTATCP
jgi:MSHA pilin protein MshC